MTLEQDAKEVRERLKVELEEVGFPYNCCKIAAVEMNKKGYGIIAGMVKVENFCGLGISREWTHYWNFDSVTGNEFDITASQFNIHIHSERMSEIAIWKPGKNQRFYAMKRDISPDYVF